MTLQHLHTFGWIGRVVFGKLETELELTEAVSNMQSKRHSLE